MKNLFISILVLISTSVLSSDQLAKRLQVIKEYKETSLSTLFNNSQLCSDIASMIEDRFKQEKDILAYEINLFSNCIELFLSNATSVQTNSITDQIQLTEYLKTFHDIIFFSKKIRRVVAGLGDSQESLYKNLDNYFESLYNKKQLTRLERKIQETLESDNFLSQSDKKILHSSSLTHLVKEKISLTKSFSRKMFFRDISDGLGKISTNITTTLSKGFGAAIGNISWREGYLKNNSDLLTTLKKDLKPFDILMEKKKYKLTDYTIPGYWGHAGVYIGTKDQLIKENLWNSPFIQEHKEKIESGKVIYQVRRWGLVWDTLEDFINLDEMAILRLDLLNDYNFAQKESIIENLMSQIDKTYDFGFDLMSTNKVTCTEIIAFSYGKVNWPTSTVLGRKTFTPNHLAELVFYNNSPLKYIAFYGGNEKGDLIDLGKEQFAKNINYVDKEGNGNFELEQRECERKWERKNRRGLVSKYKCNNSYQKKTYLEI